eukprot:TRINITY_DN415_c1_g2_i1.p1 TRINITY_DN415_c1_g2~~TRINITY_DN415_c1_g2_i1.p1  ORF type:complete len:489 (-),score=155.57 TRINITY_DN415_c1_g2_i1:53-1519(-)
MDFQQWLRSTLVRLNFSNLARAENDIRQLVEKIQFTFSSSPYPPSALQILKIGYGQAVLSMQGALGTSPPFPITLYIRPDYPLFPPIAFFTGRLQGPHPHIDGSGFVFHPSINQWNPSSSSLLSLVSDLAFTFSHNPAIPRPQQVSPPQHQHQHQPQHHHHQPPQIVQPQPPIQTQSQTQMQQQNTMRIGGSGGVPYGFPYQALPPQGSSSSQPYQPSSSQPYQPMGSQGAMMAKAPSTGSLPSSSSSSSVLPSTTSTRSMPTSTSSISPSTNTSTIINPFSPTSSNSMGSSTSSGSSSSLYSPFPSSSSGSSPGSSAAPSVSSGSSMAGGPGKETPPVPQRNERLGMEMVISGRLSGILEEKMKSFSSLSLPPSSSPSSALPSLSDLERQIEDMESALVREAAAISSVESFDLDRHTDWPDPFSRQLSGLMADDLTIEDAMYELAVFHRQGALSLDSLTKLVRTLSNDQFMVRATRSKMSEMRSVPS